MYYKVGHSKLDQNKAGEIELLFASVVPNKIDSMVIYGVADTTGNERSNLKLCMKRAVIVRDHIMENRVVQIPYRIVAVGESAKVSPEKSRRVDIVIYVTYPEELVIPIPSDTVAKDESRCYAIADKFLSGCHQTVVKKGRKEVVQLEMEPDYMEATQLYTAHKDPKKAQITLKPVKWKRKITGNWWWKTARLTATVPKEDFDRFKLVTLEYPPCKSCAVVLTDTLIADLASEREVFDPFLSRYTQFHFTIFHKDRLVIRAPREYVDTTKPYILANAAERTEINWQVKRGPRNKLFYIDTVTWNSLTIAGIYTTGRYCVDTFPYDRSRILDRSRCGTRWPTKVEPSLTAETGYLYTGREHLGYVGLTGYFAFRRLLGTMFVGYNSNSRFFGYVHIDRFTRFGIPISFKTGYWKTKEAFNNNWPWAMHGYAGLGLRNSFHSLDTDMEGHIGLALLRNREKKNFGLCLVTLQLAQARNFRETGQEWLTQIQLGLTFQLF